MLKFPNNKVYIGITMRDPKIRWGRGSNYKNNKEMYKDIQKFKWKNIKKYILKENMNKEFAEQQEVEFIAKYQANNPSYGYNIRKGGSAGVPLPGSIKKKISMSRIGKNNPMYGKYGSEHHNAKEINQYSLKGKYIKTWDSGIEAANDLGVTLSKIVAVCRGKRKSTGGYQWRYHEGNIDDIDAYKIKNREGKNNPMYGIIGVDNHRSKEVTQYNLNGEIVGVFVSATEAEQKTGYSLKNITSCCRGERKTSHGFIWEYT